MLKFSKAPDSVVNIVGPFSWLQRSQVASYGFWVYLLKFVFPFNLSCFYPYPESHEMNSGTFPVLLWLSLVGFIIITLLVIRSVRKSKLYLFGLGFFLVTLLLVLQFLSVGKAMLAERYSYLPYIGISVIPAYFVSQYPGRNRNWLLFFAGSFVLVMLLLARNQVEVWHDTKTLWSQAIENHPGQELAWRARGKYFYGLSGQAGSQIERKNLEDKAISDFKMAIEHKTASSDVYEGMGMILQSRGELKTALKLLNLAVSLNPANGRTYYNRAIIFDGLNQKDEAIKDYDTALEKDPKGSLPILRNRSALYLETGQYAKALKDCDQLILIEKMNFRHYFNRAYARVMLQDLDGALADYREVLKLNPGDKQALEQMKLLNDLKMKK